MAKLNRAQMLSIHKLAPRRIVAVGKTVLLVLAAVAAAALFPLAYRLIGR